MLLEHVSMQDLERMLTPHMAKPVWPGLTKKKAAAAQKRRARELGIWDRLDTTLARPKDIGVLPRSLYREFRRTGIRANCDAAMHRALARVRDAALGLWLDHPLADADHLQDLLWALCEQTTWVMTAHEGCNVDLGSSAVGRELAELLWVLEDRLESEVAERVGAEIETRILEPVWDYRRVDAWASNGMNWNHVCNANVITTALYRLADPRRLAVYLHPLIQRLDYALQGFADDGGCREGPGYWDFGFGHYLDAAVVLSQRTGGALDLMQGDKIARICRYPLAAHIDGLYRTTFADAANGAMQALNALKINRFIRLPELYTLMACDRQGVPSLVDWRGICLYRGEKAARSRERTDSFLPDLGQAVLRAGRSATVLAVLAGDNGVPHNHNDIGTFIYYRKGRCVLTDPGAPKYTRKTFSPQRYEILHCRSRGHSVPIVNGREQPAGEQYHGTLEVSGVGARGAKGAVIDMTHAYDDPALEALVRTFSLAPDGALTVSDAFRFSSRPSGLEEAFVTLEKATVARDGRSVAIGAGKQQATLRCMQGAGRFRADVLTEESAEGRSGVVTRIVFQPARLEQSMNLIFEVR